MNGIEINKYINKECYDVATLKRKIWNCIN